MVTGRRVHATKAKQQHLGSAGQPWTQGQRRFAGLWGRQGRHLGEDEKGIPRKKCMSRGPAQVCPNH